VLLVIDDELLSGPAAYNPDQMFGRTVRSTKPTAPGFIISRRSSFGGYMTDDSAPVRASFIFDYHDIIIIIIYSHKNKNMQDTEVAFKRH